MELWGGRVLGVVVALAVGAGVLGGCAGVPGVAFEAVAAGEAGRRPEFYVNGEARAWVVRRDGVERGLLWGTLHIAYGGETVLPGAVRARFYEAADLTVETVLDRAAVAMRGLAARVRRADGAGDAKALAGLDAGTRAALEEAAPGAVERGLSLRGLAVAVRRRAADGGALGGVVDAGATPNVGFVDLNLIAFARQQGRAVLGLEAPVVVDATLDAPNGAAAAGLLRLELRRAGTLAAMGGWVRRAYGRGEVGAAVSVLAAWRAEAADMARYDRERVEVMTRRNARWLPALVERFGTAGTHFVAVGAGHLVGEDGLVTLLRGRGFEVVACPGDVCPR